MPEVILGKDVETGKKIPIGDMERRSGLYILGRTGTGKTTLIKKIIAQDIDNGHGVFFLDPHGDAIEDLLQRIPSKRQNDVIVLDPSDEYYSFGVNPLACPDPNNMTERSRTYAQAIDIFKKLFANIQTEELDILLNHYLRNSFFPLIANQGYTLLEIPLLLEEKHFRDLLLQNAPPLTVPLEVERFWHNTFDRLRPDKQREEIASTERRLDPFGDFGEIRHIVGQSTNTIDFSTIMQKRKILFVKLKKTLPGDAWRIIGTMLVSNLVHAVRHREQLPEAARHQFCIFVDEFQNFASSDDFAVLFTEARKYGIATTIAHQERYGQFADNKAILGATDAAGNKLFFHLAVKDADEQAPEVAKASPTEIRLERQLVISQEPFTDLLRGHKHPDIHRFIQTYLRPLHYQLQDTQDDLEGERLLRLAILDEAALSRVDERYDAIEAMERGRGTPPSTESLRNTEQLLVQVQEQTERLRQLYESARALKLSIRSLNTFLTEIMEGRLQPEPGHELFSHFLLAFVPRTVTLPAAAAQVFATYISLVYGNPRLPRAIPLSLSARYLGASHEDLYQHVEAQYISQVHAYAEKRRLEADGEWDEELQDHYEWVLRRIMTWKHQQASSASGYGECFRMLKHQQVRAFLTPYFFATFQPPWYYCDPHGRAPVFPLIANPTPDDHAAVLFLHQYGEGACVTLELLRCVLRNSGYNFDPIIYRPRERETDTLALMIARLDLKYEHLHMLQLPAIAGMEPFHVWQVTTQLKEICDSIRNPNNYQRDGYSRGGWPRLLFDRRHDAQLLLAQLDPYFPDAEYLRQWWDWLTDEDMRRIGRRQAALAWAIEEHDGMVSHVAVARRVSEYREDKRRQIGQAGQAALVPTTSGGLPFVLPYVLDRMWHRCDEMTRLYLIARACDWVTYGEVLAERTFPQPTLAGIPPQEVSAAVAALIQLLLQAQAQGKADRERAWARRKEAFIRECLWQYDGILRLQVYQAEGRVHLRQTVERSLPPRVLSAAEIDRLTASCLMELPNSESLVATLAAFVRFCQLLRLPENHVRSQTAQYVEKEVNTYTTAEMRNQMAQELINLHPHSAYMSSTFKGKIQTLDVSLEPRTLLSAGRGDLVDVRTTARQNALSAQILRQRGDIEEEIRERQNNWRKRPGNEPPPPTSTGGNSPPSLPSASAGSDREAPPTHSIPEKTPEQKPPQARNGATEKGSQIQDQPPLSSEKTPAGKPSPTGSRKGRKEGAVLKRRAGQKKEHEKKPPPISGVSPMRTDISQSKAEEKSMLTQTRPLPANTPSKPRISLDLKSLRFFESGQGMLAKEQRQYSTSFQQQTARCICFDLTMRNRLYRQRDKRYLVKIHYVKPDGSHLMNHQEETVVHSDNKWSSYRWGIGAVKPGFWTPGTYRVVIFIDGVKFAEGSFVIE